MNQQEINQFFKKLSLGTASEAEKETFYQSLDALDENTYKQLLLQYQGMIQNSVITGDADLSLKERIEESLDDWDEQDDPKEIKRWNWRTIASIAAVLLFLVMGSSIYLSNRKNGIPIPPNSTVQNNYKQDVLPGGNKAFLTLADASVIVLDDINNGVIAQQGLIKITKMDETVSYAPGIATEGKMLYNKLTTPRGGQYQIVLSDGTKVWLNAGSSLRFPAAFNGSKRSVEVTGEAYFEVAKDPSKPFMVKINEAEVQVLGTHFNINAYADEDQLKTTLLEGSIRFVKGSASLVMKPGQQSQLAKDGQVQLIKRVNLENVIAWKNGFFHFENENIESVMRQLSRWYNVDVVYAKNVEKRFYAEIPMNTKLSDVLSALQLTGTVHFKIEGRKVIVE